MKKFDIYNLISLVIFKVDNVLYKTLGIVSSYRKHAWTLAGKRLQRDLDREHSHRDLVNSLFGHDYTTKKALEVYYQDEVDLKEW
jgi:hypothetical protein